jgi:2'-5' RNA ligase
VLSLNVPVPGRVSRLASDLAPDLAAFDRVRDRHTLVIKRLGNPEPEEYARIEQRSREALAGTRPFEARVEQVEQFAVPTAGPAPVVYLGIESPGLLAVHERMVEEFSRIDGLEGHEYTPHVTLARGGSREAASTITDRDIDPVTWTVNELVFWDGANGKGGPAGRVRLPA